MGALVGGVTVGATVGGGGAGGETDGADVGAHSPSAFTSRYVLSSIVGGSDPRGRSTPATTSH